MTIPNMLLFIMVRILTPRPIPKLRSTICSRLLIHQCTFYSKTIALIAVNFSIIWRRSINHWDTRYGG